MGQVVQWAEVEARRLRARAPGWSAPGWSAAGAPARSQPAFEAVDCGGGWYHGEAIRAADPRAAEPR